MNYVKAFLTGDLIYALVQILMEKVKMMSGHIIVLLVVSGTILGAVGVCEPFAKWAGTGAEVPLLGSGNTLWKGVKEAIGKDGILGVFKGRFTASSAEIRGTLMFGYLIPPVFKPKMKQGVVRLNIKTAENRESPPDGCGPQLCFRLLLHS